VFTLAFLHARRAVGAGRACAELLVLAAYGFALELAAIRTFASHAYGNGWAIAPLGVPVAVAVVWAAVISSAMALAARLGPRTATGRGAAAAAVAIALDFVMEPVAVRSGLWSWTPPGPWLGIPVGNFVGWAVVVGAYTAAAERWRGQWPLGATILVRCGLAAASIGALLAVGSVWTRLEAERFFAGGRSWGVWAGVLAAAMLSPHLSGGPRPAPLADPVPSLPERLALPAPTLPAAVLLLLAAVFAADAVLLGSWGLSLLALGSLVVLAAVGRAAGARA
jgi:uncharacterized membrane protein